MIKAGSLEGAGCSLPAGTVAFPLRSIDELTDIRPRKCSFVWCSDPMSALVDSANYEASTVSQPHSNMTILHLHIGPKSLRQLIKSRLHVVNVLAAH